MTAQRPTTRRSTLALALCLTLLAAAGCTKPGTFTDPEPRCAVTAENVFWAAAYFATHMFASRESTR